MKNILKSVAALLLISMSACRDISNTMAHTEEVSGTVSGNIFDETDTYETYITPVSEEQHEDELHYQYAPPREVLETEFYCDRIEAEIVFESLTEDIFGDPDAICSALPERVPEDIVDDLLGAIADNTHFRADDLKPVDLKPIDVSCFEYDLNSDENVDYLFSVQMSGFSDDGTMWSPPYYHFEMAFISQESEFMRVELPVYQNALSVPKYVLSSQTNGLKDMMVFHNSNKPDIQYDGSGSYGNAVELDEKHTFIKGEILSDNILHMNLNLSVIERLEEYYVAVRFAENPYLKNDLLYTSYPDGAPRSYSGRGKDDAVSFSPSIEGFDLYIELNDDAVANGFDVEYMFHYLDLLEIRYIAVRQ